MLHYGNIRIESFKLFADYKMVVLYFSSMFLGGALQLTNVMEMFFG
jgi:NHS family xanthosine MFS transporter